MKRVFAVMVVALGPICVSSVARAGDPTTADCLAANDKSITLRNQHQLRAARSELLVCAASNCPADIRNECSRRVSEVNAAIPTMAFEAKDTSGNDLSAVKVTMDGVPLAERLEGSALSIDPGEHSFVFETAGQPAVTKRFIIMEGAKDRRELITFGNPEAPVAAGQAPPMAAPAPLSPALPSYEPASPAPDTTSSGKTARILGWTATGLGVVGLGLGAVFEAQRSSKLDDRAKVCASGTNCAPGSQARINALTDDARSASTLGVASFVVGGLLVAGGLTLVFTAPSGRPSGSATLLPVVLPEFQGLTVSGRVW
jgi:hypothetical protein